MKAARPWFGTDRASLLPPFHRLLEVTNAVLIQEETDSVSQREKQHTHTRMGGIVAPSEDLSPITNRAVVTLCYSYCFNLLMPIFPLWYDLPRARLLIKLRLSGVCIR